MQKPCLFGLLLVTLSAPVAASDADAAAAMDALLARHHKADAPGCAVGAYRGAGLLHAGAFGMANLELGVPITPASAFDIGSTSKQFTALSALMLARDGKLSLDDDIRRYVPELPAYAAPITLRHLLNHTGGVRDYIDLLRMSGAHDDDVTTARRALRLLALQQGTHFAPGDRHEYSNSGYFLVALAVEKASGKSLRAFAQERIFAPLGMRHSLYRDDHAELVSHRAMAYEMDDQKGWRLDVSNWEQMGDGGIVTTVGDLAAWNGNFTVPVVADAALLRELHERATLADGSQVPYALGVIHGIHRGHAKVEHGGSWGGYVSNFVRFPEHGLGVAVLCNSPDQPLDELVHQVADLYLPAAPGALAAPAQGKREVVPQDAARLQAWVGTYRGEWRSGVISIRFKHGALEVQKDDEAYPLQPVGDRTAQVGNVPVDVLLTLEPATQDRPRRVRQEVDGAAQGEFLAFEPAASTPAQLRAYAGTYRCPEVEADYRVQVAGDSLAMVSPRGDATTLAQREAGYFAGDGRVLQFTPAAAASAPGLRLGTTRAQGLRCERISAN